MRLVQTGIVFGIALVVMVASTAAPVTAALGSGSSDVLPQQGGITDTDRDGIPDDVEGTGDPDNDGTPNHLDDDSDNDGILDADEHGWDTNGDGVGDFLSLDSDGDGIPDADELAGDVDLDGRLNYRDLDSDGDSVPDAEEGTFGFDSQGIRVYTDSDGDTAPDYLDDDDDDDGIPTATEQTALWTVGNPSGYLDGIPSQVGGLELGFDLDGDGFPNRFDDDSDGDGITDSFEGAGDVDGDGLPNFLDGDSDGDLIPDAEEGFGNADLAEDTLPNYIDDDSDGDGIPDRVEGGDPVQHWLVPVIGTNPQITTETFEKPRFSERLGSLTRDDVAIANATVSPPDDIPNYFDSDSDNDGIPDEMEGYVPVGNGYTPPFLALDSDRDDLWDADERELGTDPYNVDSDGNGLWDGYEVRVGLDPTDPTDDRTLDSDGDTLSDVGELSLHSSPFFADSDRDGEPDNEEARDSFRGPWTGYDTDRDGLIDSHRFEQDGDLNGDGIPNFRDPDDDGDLIPTIVEEPLQLGYSSNDTDGDGISDTIEVGVRVSQLLDGRSRPIDTDDDSAIDANDRDSDDDGLADEVEGTDDFDGDGLPNYLDDDSDNDGIYDGIGGVNHLIQYTPQSPALEGLEDLDTDGKLDYLDDDTDGDGIGDSTEGTADPDRDGLANFRDTDSDDDGISDEEEITQNTDPYVPEPDPTRDQWLEGVPGGPDLSTDTTDQVGLAPDARMGEVLDWIKRSGGVEVPGGLFASERVDVRLVADDGTTELGRGFVVTRGGRVISAEQGEGSNPTMRVYVTEGAATRLVDSPDRVRTLQDELDAGTIRYEGIGVVGGLKVTFAKFVYTVWKFIRGFSLLIYPPLITPSG